jgi:hypothetical protein
MIQNFGQFVIAGAPETEDAQPSTSSPVSNEDPLFLRFNGLRRFPDGMGPVAAAGELKRERGGEEAMVV